MPIYNNPAIGQAFNNLADAFKPASGSDMYGYARAGTEKLKQGGLVRLFELANDPKLTPQQRFDRVGQATDQWNPNQGYYAVNTADATDRRGQDIESRTLLSTNAADNARALRERAMMEAAALNRQLHEPVLVNENQTAFLPRQTQEATGLEDVIMGSVNVGEDEITQTPAGTTVEGPRSPMTESEFTAAIMSGMAPELQQAYAARDIPVETVMGEDGPRNVTRLDSFGQRPAPSTSMSNVRMYRTGDGRTGRTTDGLSDMVTGEPIPADATISELQDTSQSFGDTEMRRVREALLERQAAVRSMTEQVNRLDETLAQADSAQALGIVGSGSRILNDLATQAGALYQAAGFEAPDELRNVQQYQNDFRAMGVRNAETQSALLDLAYATASAREPGRLSENDVQRALRTIGGNLQDPLAMRQVLRGAVERVRNEYQSLEDTYRNQYGDALQLQDANLPSLREFGPAAPSAPAAAPAQAPAAERPTGAGHPPPPPDNDGWTVLPDGTRIREVR